MGIKTSHLLQYFSSTSNSEKPPHHMGIKTGCPVEWQRILGSEKPPHHMGIKTKKIAICLTALHSEKPPHHMGIKTTVRSHQNTNILL